MAELVKEAKVRYAGVSNFDMALLQRCETIRHVDSLQRPYSLLRPEAVADLMPWCLAKRHRGDRLLPHAFWASHRNL